jgi:hypothetical protein
MTHIERVGHHAARGTWLVGWQPEAPVGLDALRRLSADVAIT